jgi:tetratricopeptide (TPR) repeat protein
VDECIVQGHALRRAGQLTRAAQNYLTIVSVNKNSSYAGKAVFAAAQCYEKTGLLENALQTYDRYVKSYQSDPSQYLEALGKAGEICFKRKDYTQAADYYQKLVSNYKNYRNQSLPIDTYIPTQAQFMLGEIRFESYRQVNLDPPLDRSLQRKQALFKEVLALYNEAAALQVAEWTTAASHRIGAAFEEFGRAFWESPRRKSMKTHGEIRSPTHGKSAPFKERALRPIKPTSNKPMRMALPTRG